MICPIHHAPMYPAPGYEESKTVMLCRHCTNDDAVVPFNHCVPFAYDPYLEPIFIVASTDDGREWAATGHPIDLTKLEEVTCHKHER